MKRFKKYVEGRNDLFIPFIMSGDPNEQATIELAVELQDRGANVIELGIPYSDPLADGPVIQEAASRSLKNNTTLESSIKSVKKMREKGLKIPVIIFTYYNLLLQLGEDYFFALARENEVDGILVPDLPYEEGEHLRALCEKEGLALISLVAPTTSEERLQQIAGNASGFLYCVSSLGVTGVRSEFHASVFAFLEKVKKYSSAPVAVGFGVSKAEQVEALKESCDGVIVGSALIKRVASHEADLQDPKTREKAIKQIGDFAAALTAPYRTEKLST
ncbi:tryptophan synthase subunit alpha [Pseudalkalibacillus caeni]|uniref:tryptophan synthase subunit alpha n=1 Tax=Exobacillus caeni TaxID=2574798 RepID=UPI002482AF67|nr:tryptophan synthase subunit alpha [Pseudalkalibacillus caeni]